MKIGDTELKNYGTEILHKAPGWTVRRSHDPYNIQVLRTQDIDHKDGPLDAETEITVLKNALAQKYDQVHRLRAVLRHRYGEVIAVMESTE
jgi:biopolymer transport protein ExbD